MADYASLRDNNGEMAEVVQVHGSELIHPDLYVFPVREARIAALQLFKSPTDVKLPELTGIDIELPFEGQVSEPTVKSRENESITLNRLQEYGKTPNCAGCDAVGTGSR